MRLRRGRAGGLLAVTLIWAAVPAAPQGLSSAFTDQGRLTDGGSPADGAYDLEFALFDAASGGTQVGPHVDPRRERAGTRIGMVAQQVETVFPDWVGRGADGYRYVTFRGFEALTVEALRDLRSYRP